MSFDQLPDDVVLEAIYQSYQGDPLVMELAKRLEQANERAERTEETPTTF